MLTTKLTHPQMLSALGSMGHGSMVLIADGNFPFGTHTNPAAAHVYLNLRPGLVSATDVLEAVVSVIPVEAAHVMEPADGSTPPIFAEFSALLPGQELQRVERFAFYDLGRRSEVGLVIATGEARIYANILLTIGVVKP
ncbi:MAG: RbsD or FucU transport [Chloroflexi bacterium]|nr:RbsD or FucU transport [Chloroflexota bacterium]